MGLNGYSVVDQVTGFTLDGTYDAGLRWVDKILFGFGESLREKTRDDDSNDWTNGSGQYGTLVQYLRLPCSVQPLLVRLAGLQRHLHGQSAQFHAGGGGLVSDHPAADSTRVSCWPSCAV